MPGSTRQQRAHQGRQTGTGSKSKRVGPAVEARTHDRDCARYEKCLEDVLKANPRATHVCSFPCGRFVAFESHAVPVQGSPAALCVEEAS
ncbi:MAG: hypothetical protein WC683_16095 [bacterium]